MSAASNRPSLCSRLRLSVQSRPRPAYRAAPRTPREELTLPARQRPRLNMTVASTSSIHGGRMRKRSTAPVLMAVACLACAHPAVEGPPPPDLRDVVAIEVVH